jgi:outer membrane protein
MPTKIILSLLLCSSLLSAKELSELCQKGITHNPKIKSFEHKSSASYSFYDQNEDRYKPSLTLSGQIGQQEYTYDNALGGTTYSGETHSYRATLKQVIYNSSLGYNLIDAKAKITLAKLQEEEEKAKLITQILQSSFELLKLQQTMELYHQKEQILQKAYENIQKSHALKLASKVDTFQALARLQQSRSDLARVRQIYNQTLFNLRLLTKFEDVESYINNLKLDVNSISKEYRAINLSAIKSQYHNSTRVKLDRQMALIAKAQVGIRQSRRDPSLNIVLSGGDAGGTLDSVTRQNETSAMLTVDFPLYQGGYVEDSTQEAEYLYLSAMAEAENTEMTIKISLQKSLQDIASGLESAKADKIAIDASRNYLEATMQSYEAGVGSLTDAYLAEAEYHDSQVRLINTNASIFSSLAEVYYYAGKATIDNVKKMQKKHIN